MDCEVSRASGISTSGREQCGEDEVDCESGISYVSQSMLPIVTNSISPNYEFGGFLEKVDADENSSIVGNSRISKKRKMGIFPEETAVEKGDCVVDVNYSTDQREGMCRVCQLSGEGTANYGDLIQLGCNCRSDLGTAHRCCAEAWFVMRGDTCCEICGVVAKNVVGVVDNIFLLEWNDRPCQNSTEVFFSWSRERHKCSFVVMVTMVIVFILLWSFHLSTH